MEGEVGVELLEIASAFAKPRNDVQSLAMMCKALRCCAGMEGEVGDELQEIASAFAKPRNDVQSATV